MLYQAELHSEIFVTCNIHAKSKMQAFKGIGIRASRTALTLEQLNSKRRFRDAFEVAFRDPDRPADAYAAFQAHEPVFGSLKPSSRRPQEKRQPLGRSRARTAFRCCKLNNRIPDFFQWRAAALSRILIRRDYCPAQIELRLVEIVPADRRRSPR